MKSESRHLTWAWLVAAVLFFAFGTQSALAATGLAGSKHDFSTMANASGQICIACHAPHNGGNNLLWNHTASTATYTMYASSTMNAQAGTPGSTSKLCLSCHDGTVAIDSFGGLTPAAGIITGAAKLGIDLSNDHPIGIDYTDTLATEDGGLKVPSTAAALGGTIATKLLFANKLECASCHDVHNALGNVKLVRINNAGSALCTTCHTK